jgi:hypothetical protein
MIMTRADSPLPLAEVTDRLRVSGHGYVGVRSIPLHKIIGSVDPAGVETVQKTPELVTS